MAPRPAWGRPRRGARPLRSAAVPPCTARAALPATRRRGVAQRAWSAQGTALADPSPRAFRNRGLEGVCRLTKGLKTADARRVRTQHASQVYDSDSSHGCLESTPPAGVAISILLSATCDDLRRWCGALCHRIHRRCTATQHQHDSKVCRKRAHCAPCAGGGTAAPPLGATTFTVSNCPPAQWPSVEHEKWNVPAAVSACRYGDASGPDSSDPPSKLHAALGTDHTCSQQALLSQSPVT